MDAAKASGREKVRASAFELLAWAVAIFAGTAVVTAVLSLVPGAMDSGALLLFGGPVSMAIAGGVYWFVENRGNRAIGDAAVRATPLMPLHERASLGRSWGMVALHAGAAIAGSVVLSYVLEWVGAPVSEQNDIVELVERGHPVELAVLSLAALVLAPITEEYLFRGMLFRRLKLGAGLAAAYSITAIAFAVIHYNPSGALTYAWLALCFASVYARTGRLWTAVAVHSINNALTLALLLTGVG